MSELKEAVAYAGTLAHGRAHVQSTISFSFATRLRSRTATRSSSILRTLLLPVVAP
jgi:hypothetical protein